MCKPAPYPCAFTSLNPPTTSLRQLQLATSGTCAPKCLRLRAVPSPKLSLATTPQTKDPPRDALILRTLRIMRASRIVLCVRMEDANLAISAARAALRGGIRCIEITLTTPDAISLIAQLRHEFPDAIIGAGTVLTLCDVHAIASVGAAFAMSPATDVSVVRAAHARSILAIPGTATPSEVCHAYYSAGAHVVKVFPIALCGGIDFVRALQGPLGHIPLLPTSGIQVDNVTQFLQEANVFGIGASSQIVTRHAVLQHDWDTITRNSRYWMDLATRCFKKDEECL